MLRQIVKTVETRNMMYTVLSQLDCFLGARTLFLLLPWLFHSAGLVLSTMDDGSGLELDETCRVDMQMHVPPIWADRAIIITLQSTTTIMNNWQAEALLPSSPRLISSRLILLLLPLVLLLRSPLVYDDCQWSILPFQFSVGSNIQRFGPGPNKSGKPTWCRRLEVILSINLGSCSLMMECMRPTVNLACQQCTQLQNPSSTHSILPILTQTRGLMQETATFVITSMAPWLLNIRNFATAMMENGRLGPLRLSSTVIGIQVHEGKVYCIEILLSKVRNTSCL